MLQGMWPLQMRVLLFLDLTLKQTCDFTHCCTGVPVEIPGQDDEILAGQ